MRISRAREPRDPSQSSAYEPELTTQVGEGGHEDGSSVRPGFRCQFAIRARGLHVFPRVHARRVAMGTQAPLFASEPFIDQQLGVEVGHIVAGSSAST